MLRMLEMIKFSLLCSCLATSYEEEKVHSDISGVYHDSNILLNNITVNDY